MSKSPKMFRRKFRVWFFHNLTLHVKFWTWWRSMKQLHHTWHIYNSEWIKGALTIVSKHSLISIEVAENFPLKSESTTASWKSQNETFWWFEKQNLFHILNITKKLWHIEYIDTRPLHTFWTAINFTTSSKCYSCLDNQWKHLTRQPAAIKTHQIWLFPFLFSLN